MDQSTSEEREEIKRRSRKKILDRTLFAIACLLGAIFLTLSQTFAWGRVNALSERVVQLRTQLEQRGSKSDCLALYRNDVSTALGVAVAANNNLLYSLAIRDPNLTPEEQAQDNKRLGDKLKVATEPLINASKALSDYDALDPKPDICPHPDEDVGGSG